jgi:hypothetical protein
MVLGMNASYIEQLLSVRNTLSVRELGTFTITSSPAKPTGSAITPPQRKVEFNDGIWNENDSELEDFILIRNPKMSRESVQRSLVEFAILVRDQVRRNGSFSVGKIGSLVPSEWGGLKFQTSAAFESSGSFFGLPKLNVLPLQEQVNEGVVVVPLVKKETSVLLLLVILIPLVLVGAGATYLFFNPDAYTRYKEGRLFEPKKSETPNPVLVQDTLNQDSTLLPETKPVVDSSDKSDKALPKNQKTEIPEVKAPENKAKPQAPVSSSMVVNAATNRFYVVVQVAKTVEEGKKMAAKLKASGYPGAKVIASQGKVRVSLQDYETKAQADMLKNKVAASYQGAWVLNF